MGTNGRSWLVILMSCLIFICLGYVQLCHRISQRVAIPTTPEYWQIRTLGLQFRNPESEAQAAVASGDHRTCQFPGIPSSVPQRIARDGSVPAKGKQQRLARAAGDFTPFGDPPDLIMAIQQFDRASREFARRYNRELSRIGN